MHVVNPTMKVHRSAPLQVWLRARLPLWLGGGPKGPPSAPPAIPPIIINPFSREAPRQPNIDPLRTPPPPPIRRPGPPSMRMRA
jgi:hypothetical protein